LEEAKQLPGCYYLRPPVAHFGTLEFGNFEAIHKKGYEYGKEIMKQLEKDGSLELFVGKKASKADAINRTRRNSI
jgi:lysophospholipid hydrolase